MVPATRPAFHAWVDESMHHPSAETPAGMYILAAAIADPGLCGPPREALRKLLIGKAQRLHWRDESRKRQRKIATTIARHDLLHAVVVGTPLDPKRQERCRRHCLERLLHELADMDVSKVWLESRTQSLNRKDIEMIAAVRSKKLLPASMNVDFALPSEEPMLWIPDTVAGAVGAHRKAADSSAHKILRGLIHEIELEMP